jgi:uncharacterized SAM-binding protein YcdF (DUF218 family)
MSKWQQRIRNRLEVLAWWIITNFHCKPDPMPSKADAIACVGIGTDNQDKGPNSRLLAIILEATKLFNENVFRYAILLGGNRSENGGLCESVIMDDKLQLAIPDQQRIISVTDKNTYQNAETTLRIMKEYQLKSVIVLAEAWHARRVKLIFKRVFRKSGMTVFIKPILAKYEPDSSGKYITPLSFVLYESFLATPYSLLKGWLI